MANPNATVQGINMTIPTTTTLIEEINNRMRLKDAAIKANNTEVLRLLRVISETQGDW
jgi:hypothetical protein